MLTALVPPPKLTALDLNLLLVLDALYEERNASRAARRLGLTQPAVSNALARLRKALGDPLFVRSSEGMAPTPRAAQLAEPVRRALAEVQRALAPEEHFDPLVADATFSVAATDYAGFVLMPALIARVAREAPRVRLQVRALGEALPLAELEAGQIDLAVGFRADDLPGLQRQVVLTDKMVCVTRADHPALAGATLDLERFVALEHALVATRGGTRGMVDHELAERGLTRRVAVVLPHFLAAPRVVARSDYVLTLPQRVARYFAAVERLRVHEPPVPLPNVKVTQVWHLRSDLSAAHRWLRAAVLEAARASDEG